MMTPVTRHFATLGRRQVHYRRAGSGPAVLLLHQSPASSAELVPIMQHLAGRFTAIAPDMPGYGASDPADVLPPTVESLADGVVALMDELGIATAALYGYHTGASIATSLARRRPARVAGAVCEGLLCLEPQERDAFLSRYIEPFVARWDASHLAWLWTRLKDQSVFFPWHDRSGAARLELDAAPHEILAVKALDWLRSGERYWHGYAAAFSYDPRPDLAAIRTPHHVICHRHDPLAAHLPRLPWTSGALTLHRFPTAAQGFDLVRELLTPHAAGPPAPAAAAARPIEGRAWQDYVLSHGVPLRVLRAGEPRVHGTVVQHDARSSLRACAPLLAAFAASRHGLAVELPGHGETDLPANCDAGNLESLAGLLLGALDALGIESAALIGIGAGAAVQTAVARARPELAASLTLIAPIDVTREPQLQSRLRDSYRPPHPDPSGCHLLQAWHEVRDHLLFFPWYERRRAFAVAASPRLEPAFLQSRTVDLLLAGAAGVDVRKAELDYPLRARLGGLALTPRVAAPLWEPRYAHSQRLAQPPEGFFTLSRHGRRWARDIDRLEQSLESP